MIYSLSEVYQALDQGEYRTAVQHLQELLRTEPSADAWYLAAELIIDKDRDQAIRHLKRALLLNPRHGDSLTLLGQLGESPDITLHDVAEEVADVVSRQANHTPGLSKLSRPQQFMAFTGLLVLVAAALVFSLNALSQRNAGPSYIPPQAPQAKQSALLNANTLFARFSNGALPLFGIEQIKGTGDTGRDTLKFSVYGPDGTLQPAQIIVYHSISALVHDRSTQRNLEATSLIVAQNNALLVYSKNLQGLTLEHQLVRQFKEITGTS